MFRSKMIFWGIALYILGASRLAQASLVELGEKRPIRSVAPIQDARDQVNDDSSLRDPKKRRTEVGEYSEQDRFGQDQRQAVDQTWLDKQAEIKSMEQASQEIHRSIAYLKWVAGSHEEALNSIQKLEDVHSHLERRYRKKNKAGILRKAGQYKHPSRRVKFVIGAENSGEGSSGQLASERLSDFDSGPSVFPLHEWDDLVRLTEPENEFCRNRPDFKLSFVETMFLLGDYMIKSNLLDSSFFKSNNFFQPGALTQLIKGDLKSRLYGMGGLFFRFDTHTLLPTIESLAKHKSTKHLHRSIKALDEENHKEIVYDQLGNTMRCLDWPSVRAWGEKSMEFGIFSSRFQSPYFIQDADELSSILRRFKGTTLSNHFESHAILLETQHAINLFNKPPKLTNGKRSRLEFLMSYYYLDFLNTYYKEILDQVQAKNFNNQNCEEKLEFIGEAIKIVTDPADPWKTKFDKYAQLIFKQEPQDDDLGMKEWIEAITSIILEVKVSGVIDRASYIASRII